MPSDERNFPRGIIWLGLPLMLMGGAAMISAGQIPSEETKAPEWLSILFGLMFFNAGITVSLMDFRFNAFRQKLWFAYFHGLALISIPLIMLLLFNWVSFGPGEREFSISISLPFLSEYFGRTNEWIGRLVFGIPTFLVDMFILYVVGRVLFDKISAWVNNGVDKLEET